MLITRLFYRATRKYYGNEHKIEIGARANEMHPDAAEFQIRELRKAPYAKGSDVSAIQTRRVMRDGVAEHQISLTVEKLDSAGRCRTHHGALTLTDEEAAFLAEALTGHAEKFVVRREA